MASQQKDHGKRTAIVTGSSRGMYVLPSKILRRTESLADTRYTRGKAIAIRLAEDGFDMCINDVEANQAGIDEVRFISN